MNKRRAGIALLVIGAVLILSALLLFAYNVWEDANAGSEAEDILNEVQTAITDGKVGNGESDDEEVPPMSVTNIGGYDYIGYLHIPDLKLELPVMSEWDYTRLKKAPCRHFGSTYSDDLVIAAHNYNGHFGRLKNLEIGAVITFTDMEGVLNTYSVAEHMTVGPYDVELIRDSEYDLILYTCTYGGKSRVAVGCVRTEDAVS